MTVHISRRKKTRKREQISSSPLQIFLPKLTCDMEVEDPFPKSKRKQWMERIWAQDNITNPHAAGMEVKILFSPKIHLFFCCFWLPSGCRDGGKKSCSPLKSTCSFVVSGFQFHS